MSAVPRATETVRGMGVELWTEVFGEASAPAVLLVSGMTGQAIRWPQEFCDMFAVRGFRVIRFDHRDTGLSSTVDYDAAPYSLDDMAGDVAAVMDGLGIRAAHLVGSSMGAMIAQILALSAPQRVLTLTSMLSTPLTANFNRGMPVADLPGPDPAYVRRRAELLPKPPATFEESVEQRVIDYSLICQPPFDPRAQRDFILEEHRRAKNFPAALNHLRAMEGTRPLDRRRALRSLHVPALVVHGREDPALPLAHGIATAQAIPGARLLVLDGVGHEFPRRAWAQVIDAIVEMARVSQIL
jgi:pimeloyl-ACP methyl ester carboxylesterase